MHSHTIQTPIHPNNFPSQIPRLGLHLKQVNFLYTKISAYHSQRDFSVTQTKNQANVTPHAKQRHIKAPNPTLRHP